MSVLRRISPPLESPVVLVVDDDRRVLELLDIAFQAHGFKVVTAADGDEAIRQIAASRPDLLVMDVRLPKKSGLEVCEIVRRDPIDGNLPVIMVSAASETEARLRAFACGCDDFMPKPFSPKELIARMRRLLARTADTRDLTKRAEETRLDLQRANSDRQRAHETAESERRLRDAVLGPGREMQRSLDVDQVCRTLLVALQTRTGLDTVAVLLADGNDDVLVPRAIRGDGFDRLHAIRIARTGGMAEVVRGLHRLVKRTELDGLRELRDEIGPLIAAGFGWLAPLETPEGLVGLLLAEEPHDGRALERIEVDETIALCDVAASAVHSALRATAATRALVRALTHAATARHDPQEEPLLDPRDRTWREEAREIVTRAAAATWLPPRQRELLAWSLEAGLPGADLETLAAIERHVAEDPTGRLAEMLEIERLAIRPAAGGEAPLEVQRAALLLFVARRYAAQRKRGVEAGDALTAAGLEAAEALDPETAQALNGALREYA